LAAIMEPSELEERVCGLLSRQRAGSSEARQELFELLYHELRRMAVHQMRSERPDHTLAPTSLVHEVFLRLQRTEFDGRDRGEFLRFAATVMRHVLVDSARRKRKWRKIVEELSRNGEPREEPDSAWVLYLEEALEELSRMDADLMRVVELRFLLGMSVEDVASALDISTPTVKRRWRTARAWLERSIRRRQMP
jgi:RNA polymerase sigma factor (TIGR02999 family)